MRLTPPTVAGPFFHMSSFAEAKAMGYYQSKSPFFTEYNKRQLSRIYPAGRRVDSSNYSPVPLWNMGCQIGVCTYVSVCVCVLCICVHTYLRTYIVRSCSCSELPNRLYGVGRQPREIPPEW